MEPFAFAKLSFTCISIPIPVPLPPWWTARHQPPCKSASHIHAPFLPFSPSTHVFQHHTTVPSRLPAPRSTAGPLFSLARGPSLATSVHDNSYPSLTLRLKTRSSIPRPQRSVRPFITEAGFNAPAPPPAPHPSHPPLHPHLGGRRVCACNGWDTAAERLRGQRVVSAVTGRPRPRVPRPLHRRRRMWLPQPMDGSPCSHSRPWCRKQAVRPPRPPTPPP